MNRYCISLITGSFLSRHVWRTLNILLNFCYYVSTNIDIRFSMITGFVSCCRPNQNIDSFCKTINAWTNECPAVSSVCFVKDGRITMQIIDVHVDAGSSSGSTQLTLGLDTLHVGLTFLKVFSFFLIAVNGYSFRRIHWCHHLTLTLNDSLKV